MNSTHAQVEANFHGLYRAAHEHDSCGVGFVASVNGERSNRIVRIGLEALSSLQHRGALDADGRTGDGAGVKTQIPYKILRAELRKQNVSLGEDSDLGVGSIFLPFEDKSQREMACAIVEGAIAHRGLIHLGWRDVPVNLNVLGLKARQTIPCFRHVLIAKPAGLGELDFEQALYLVRRQAEAQCRAADIAEFYVASMSCRTLVYKALVKSKSLRNFYKDLTSPDFESAFCVFHQRYSTNTFPSWALAQPCRLLAHNGEINTIRGNRNWMKAREPELFAGRLAAEAQWLSPVIDPTGSDSASLDNTLEGLVLTGQDLLHAMTMLVPPAWEGDPKVTPAQADLHRYLGCFTEPWDGPAALVFSDGCTVGACLDRNGLRPARYKLTSDGIFFIGSEVGLSAFDDNMVVEKGRLAPGEMIAVDTINKKLLRNSEIKSTIAARQPFGQWVAENLLQLDKLAGKLPETFASDLDILTLSQRQVNFGYTDEELKLVLAPMIEKGEEAVGSMGDDSPHAVLSKEAKVLYHYFKQLFAQVTNPPIDPIRERLVMSVETTLGWRRSILHEHSENAEMVHICSPVLFAHEVAALRSLPTPHRSATVSVLWPVADGPAGLEKAVDTLCAGAEAAVRDGARILFLSDLGVDHAHTAIPMLMAVGAVHHHLTRAGLRMKASIVCETGEARDVQHHACLIGYGASAVYPYLAFETIREMLEKAKVKSVDYPTALKNFRKAIEKGLLKIMSKMGVSVIDSYRGAQLYEAIGVSPAVIAKCFTGTVSQIGGVHFTEIAEECLVRHHKAYGQAVPDGQNALALGDPGFFRFRKGYETHGYTALAIKNFHTFVRSGKPEEYSSYVQSVLDHNPINLRDLLEFSPPPGGAVPLDEVEPIEDIRRRFTSAGMSYGALSPEAHEAIAIAMNRIGGKSNSGEGGEDPRRFHHYENGDLANSAIKQVASGRFGVKAAYLANAREIEIKMAQGAKPGEGGQLPGFKVTGMIAKLRHTVEGVTLISPPPHHDIYSIEDLAQLIYDLKQVNTRARVCVKLVAEAGVGTIAAGVAKAHADIILISGHDGGTGAAPLTSLKHTGCPWELGLSEAHQVLVLNNLRNRVTLRTDGGMRSARDIIIAAMLGAEEYNFGTAALIALGCVYVRQCHLNTCPVGVATTDPKFRARFKGSPEHVINFFNGVAQETREIMASLGVRTLDELIGRTSLLARKEIPDHPKASTVDLSRLLADPTGGDDTVDRICTRDRNDPDDDHHPFDDEILFDAKDAIYQKQPVSLSYKVANTDRSIGTKLSGQIGLIYGDEGLPKGTIRIYLQGSAGQSLGAFLMPGVHLDLTGEANDYVGKGMSGGEIIVRPPSERGFDSAANVIVGNTVLYGATGGRLFINGRAGERFAVRNSGATVVVEGTGDHACEYMTTGTIVILGPVGRNFGAGMTGGAAYILDPERKLESLYNPELIAISDVTSEEDIETLRSLVAAHADKTGSGQAKDLVADWPAALLRFRKVAPKSAPAPVPVPAVTLPEPASAKV